MDGGTIVGPYLIALGIVGFRWVKDQSLPPPPARIFGVTIIMAGCGVLAQANPKLGATLAWGFVVAAGVGLGVTGQVGFNADSVPGALATGQAPVSAAQQTQKNTVPTYPSSH